MVDRPKAFSLISSQDHCQRSSPSRMSDTLWTGFEPVENLSSGLVGWSCAVVITTTPLRHVLRYLNSNTASSPSSSNEETDKGPCLSFGRPVNFLGREFLNLNLRRPSPYRKTLLSPLFSNFVQPPPLPCSCGCLVSLAECVMTLDLMCYFA